MNIKKWFLKKAAHILGFNHKPSLAGLIGIVERECKFFKCINCASPRYIVIPEILKQHLESEIGKLETQKFGGAEFVVKKATHIYCEGLSEDKHKAWDDAVLKSHTSS
jgi:hypothetical protein